MDNILQSFLKENNFIQFQIYWLQTRLFAPSMALKFIGWQAAPAAAKARFLLDRSR